ncbi:hypothetical protein DPX39_060057500 [Trypanosoma brucei equiperdum]|uniref:Uncharacterized protein n=1 Tax=Trypanosoma brucei equiperdum TaxID=630700 RepID=A0A3L6L652_9TRYP|nr:hypothetical protein DPX39_060057500 [Trypanosoma brucei equiperdum]
MEVSPNINLEGTALAPITNEPGCYKSGDVGSTTSGTHTVAIRAPTISAPFTKGDLNIESFLQERSRQQPQPAPADPTTKTSILTSDGELAQAFDKAQKATMETPERVLEQDIEAIVGEQAIQEAAKHALERTEEAIKIKEEPSKLAKKLFGGDGAKLKESFFDPLKNDKTTIPDGDGKIEGSTQVIAEGPNFAAAMAYYTVQNLKKAAQASAGAKPEGEKKDGDNKATAAYFKATEEGKWTKQSAFGSSQYENMWLRYRERPAIFRESQI